jgi:predicted  nucleic acid-binding Zn-ribbon protein
LTPTDPLDQIQSLNRKYNDICQKVEELEKCIQKERQTEDQHRQTILSMKREEEKLTKEIPTLNQNYEELKLNATNLQEQFQKDRFLQKEKLSTLNKSLEVTNKFLGMSITGENRNLCVHFTNINQKFPEKVFSFKVNVENSKYKGLKFFSLKHFQFVNLIQ